MSTTTLYDIFRTTRETYDPASHVGTAKLPQRSPGTDENLTAFPFESFANAKGQCVHLARIWQTEADMMEIDYHQPTSGMFEVRVAHGGGVFTYEPSYFISYVYHRNERVYTVTFTTRARTNHSGQ